MRIAVTGASGLVGTALSERLRRDGHEAIPVVRRVPSDHEIGWSVDERRIDEGAFDGLDGVVHLAGAGIGDRRWTESYKQEILTSRTVGTALIAQAVAEARNPPPVLVSGSAIGVYGSSLTSTFRETDPTGTGFLADVCTAWEAAAAPAGAGGSRVALLRTGLVLSAAGGTLKRLARLYRFGLGGRLGSGEQWMSWIHIDDEVGAILHLLTGSRSGPVNATAPNPVTNAELNTTMGEVLHRPSFMPIPRFGPRLLLGRELADNLLFSGQKVVPAALEADGYEFAHPTLAGALRDLLET